MLLSPHPSSIARSLLRLASLWLCLVLLAQGLTVTVVQAAGPLHRHQHQAHHHPSAGEVMLMVHRHDHGDGRRHHHAATEPGVMSEPEAAALDEALSAAAAALVAAMGLLAAVPSLRFGGCQPPVMQPARPWSMLTAAPNPPLKPPRAG